jgi:hypothetical protein
MLRIALVLALLSSICPLLARGYCDVISSFDSGMEGWTSVDGETALSNPGGYLRIEDVTGSWHWVIAPSKFHGNWEQYGSISADILGDWHGISYPCVFSISNQGNKAEYYFKTGDVVAGEWRTLSAQLNPDLWSMAYGNWSALIMNVTDFRIRVDFNDYTNRQEVNGVDNVILLSATSVGTISGRVTLQSVVSNHSALITFEIRNPGTTNIAANGSNDEDLLNPGTQVTTLSDGSYTIAEVPEGTYDVTATGLKWLRQKQTNIVVMYGGDTEVNFLNLKGGDGNNSNSINVLDLNILKGSYGKSTGNPGYDERADFDNSGVVNVLDLNILKSNYGRVGDG